jgi:hypothetical protein
MANIGKIEIVPIRQAFPHEAHNFTVWLEQNIDALSDRIGFKLTVEQREKSVGSFNVDLLCTDERGDYVIIENQLERTDHSHLGQLLTYLINLEAKTAIWVATEIRPEHQRVIDWLNEMTSENMAFFAVKVEAVRIENSPYAPLFTVLVRPDEQTREIGEQKKELAGIHNIRQRFWSELLAKVGTDSPFASITPSSYHWLGVGSGKSGITFNFTIGKTYAVVELYIDHDKDTGEINKQMFDALYIEREQIEREFGEKLDWRRLDEKRASRILYLFQDVGLRDENQWSELQDAMIQTMKRLDAALRKRIRKLAI